MSSRPGSRRSVTLFLAFVVLFVALAAWFALRPSAMQEGAFAPTPPEEGEVSTPTASELEEPPLQTERARLESPTTEPTATIPSLSSTATTSQVRGRVLDPSGRPVANASITFDGGMIGEGPTLAVSAADGSFSFACPKPRLTLVALAPGWRTLHDFSWTSELTEPGVIVVAPCRSVRGVVVDETSAPIPGAMVSVTLPRSPMAEFPFPLPGRAEVQRWSRGTDHDGRFDLACEIAVSDSRVEASHSGFLLASVPLPVSESEPLHIVLVQDPSTAVREITGTALRANGAVATGAHVALGRNSTGVGTTGAFRLHVMTPAADDAPLVAYEADQQAAVVADFGRLVRETRGNLPPQHLVLGPRSLSIQGLVQDDRGVPIEGASVSLLESACISNQSPIESLVGGQDLKISTDARGSFELRGLSDRTYRLQVYDPARMGRLETEPLPAGSSGVVIAYPPDAIVPEWRGRVVGRDGTPVAGASIVLTAVVRRMGGSVHSRGRDPVQTASDGEFVLRDVPRRLASLSVRGPGLIDLDRTLEESDFAHPATIVVDRMCKVRVEGLASSGNRRWLAVLDSEGQELMLDVVTGSSRNGTNRLEFRGGPPEEFEVSEAGVELELYEAKGARVARRPIALNPARTNVIVW